ncbi:uncharacterized protein LOC132547423 [Ylistrum balloti]|uniref:uncharacterized protein LOC132547423 n=1 Tax=Ylistrum balloti TaxID=509963 RepID=UPI0029057F54|nr:uncharacterized protein LOC132547423 [Ylistrum balloti]
MASPHLSLLENSLKQQLIPIFANLSEDILDICVRDPSNLSDLQLCIDDLLELRTYSQHLAKSTTHSPENWPRRDPVVVDSDDDVDLVGALISAESEEVQITQQFPATRSLDKDCLVTDVDTSGTKKGSSVKICEAKFKSPSFTSPQKVNLLDSIEFDSDLPRFSPISKEKSKSPTAHTLTTENDIISSRVRTSTSILDMGHTAVVHQWCQNPVKSLFTSPSRQKCHLGSEPLVSIKACDPDTVPGKDDMKPKSAPKSAVSGILSPAKLKLPASSLNQKSAASNSHKYRFNPDSFQSSSVPVIRPSVFNPDRKESFTSSDNPHSVSTDRALPAATADSVLPTKTAGTSQETKPKKIKFKKSLILPGDQSSAPTATSGDRIPEKFQVSQSKVGRQEDKDFLQSNLSHLKDQNGSLSSANKKKNVLSTSNGHLSNIQSNTQDNGLLATTSDLDMSQFVYVKGQETAMEAGACNQPRLQSQPSSNDNHGHTIILQKNSHEEPLIQRPVATSKWTDTHTPKPLQTASGLQTSNNRPQLQTGLSQSLTLNKNQTLPQQPQNLAISRPLAPTSTVIQAEDAGKMASNTSQNSTVLNCLASQSTDPSRHHSKSNVQQTSTITSNVNQLNSSSVRQDAHILSLNKPQSMPSRQQTVISTSKAEAPSIAKLSSTLDILTNEDIVASASGDFKTQSVKSNQTAPSVHQNTAAPGANNSKAEARLVTASVDTHTVTSPARGEKIQALPTTPIQATKSRPDCLVDDVLALFGDADPTYVRKMIEMELLTQRLDHEIVNNLCNLLLENHAYPRAKPSATVTSTEVKNTQVIDDVDYYEVYKKNERRTGLYYRQTEKLLMHHFIWISAHCVRHVLRWYNGQYAPTHQVLSQVMKQRKEDIKKVKGDVQYCLKTHSLHAGAVIDIIVTVYGKERPLSVMLLKNWRKTSPPMMCDLDPYLQREISFIRQKQLDEFEEADRQMALMLNETEYEESGQLIECGCCYGEVPFDNMIQCYEGHLFCEDCLQRYAKEAVFGAGKADLQCMTDGCDASFPVTQLSKALPSNILSKYEDRVQEENLNLADLPDLVRCPYCDFAAMLDPGYPVFQCANPTCEKETCRHCQEPWADHIGKTCDQVEKKDEVKLRVQFEEKMTMAKIRTCIKCKTKFTKSEGCNKMTCRCGSKMCYICRKPNIDYNHFCQHVREPGKGCDKCTACFLWSTGEEDDKRAIEEIRKEAEEARKAQGFGDSKLIGAPDEPPTKKVRV